MKRILIDISVSGESTEVLNLVEELISIARGEERLPAWLTDLFLDNDFCRNVSTLRIYAAALCDSL